ncbi:MAG TPA: hypothetical protein VMW65_00160, partial [Chloroflexota bacterium]|nr:hypothetical protein [Chloroflexota bacterium]
MAKGYVVGARQASDASASLRAMLTEELEWLVREGARQMIAAMLEVEVNELLHRARYQRGDTKRGYRNGNAPERMVGVGVGAIPILQ